MSASRAGCMSGVWKAPLTATWAAFRAPLAVAWRATSSRASLWPGRGEGPWEEGGQDRGRQAGGGGRMRAWQQHLAELRHLYCLGGQLPGSTGMLWLQRPVSSPWPLLTASWPVGGSPDTTRPWGNRKLANWQTLPGCDARTAAQIASRSASPRPTTDVRSQGGGPGGRGDAEGSAWWLTGHGTLVARHSALDHCFRISRSARTILEVRLRFQ